MAVLRLHVEQALDFIYENGVPIHRRSTGYCLLSRGLHYPPKYALALAISYESGHELQSDELYGGKPTNTELQELGYEVIPHSCRNPDLRNSN